MYCAVALTLAVGACGVDSSQRLTPTVADGSDAGVWAAEVRSAVTHWQHAIGADCTFPLTVDADGAPIVLVPSDAAGMEGDRARTFTGTDQLDVQAIKVKAIGSPLERHGVILHELGHAIGLGHEPAEDSIMHAPSSVFAPSGADVARARTALGC